MFKIWRERDYIRMEEALKETYPYSYYFYSGFTGSGVCVFSRHPIVSTLMHRYSLNGFVHHIHRGDWFGGKVVGMVELEIDSYRINLYTTHLHAEYNRENDLYLPHRISQAFELSQFVKHTSHAADAVILTGDFNLEPEDLGYQLILDNAHLKDAWLVNPESTKCGTGMTCDRPDNCYTPKELKQKNPDGKRLDYIMFRPGISSVSLEKCENRMGRIPGDKQIDYSDHLGVYAELTIGDNGHKEKDERWLTSSSLLQETIQITGEGEKRALWDRRLFLGVSFVLVAILLATLNVDVNYPAWTVPASAFRFFLTFVIAFCVCYGLIGLTIELKALKATKSSMTMLLND